jgi:hypothetical protein
MDALKLAQALLQPRLTPLAVRAFQRPRHAFKTQPFLGALVRRDFQ